MEHLSKHFRLCVEYFLFPLVKNKFACGAHFITKLRNYFRLPFMENFWLRSYTEHLIFRTNCVHFFLNIKKTLYQKMVTYFNKLWSLLKKT